MDLSNRLISHAKSNWRKRILSVKVGEEEEQIEVRAPSAAQRALAMKEGEFDAGKGSVGNVAAFQVRLVISCCYYPEGTEHAGKRVFSTADKESLMDLPGGGVVDELAAVASELMSGAAEEGKG